MREFVDLTGASGAAYRFRAWPTTGHHIPTAGNFAVLVFENDRPEIVALGVSSDLSRAKAAAQETLTQTSGYLFTRLNVSRASRHAEHDDLLASQPKAATFNQEI
ncbi:MULTISPECIES: hypothetical protein [Phenylobacterium]|uniref:Uncharacterized protein n=1 Tax=Phenylobacterium koreense TaxID=266125 RepID=A0ABV2EEH6_9CAUL